MQPFELGRPMALQAGFQNYSWGDRYFIPELFGLTTQGQPYAEAWLGAHPRLPALVAVGDAQLPLDRVLRDEPRLLLGPDVATRFGGLPYLLKVLAAAQPLSIQVHPSREQAVAGFLREETDGIGMDARERNYRDQNHKPELLVALTPFFALCGFRAPAEIWSDMAGLSELQALLPSLNDQPGSLAEFVASYLHLPHEPRVHALRAWLGRLESRTSSHGFAANSLEQRVIEAHEAMPGAEPDPGLFFFVLLNLLELVPGQGLFLSDGVPHAYLKGAGVEVMANSDNVLRCGLTSKHTDVAELLAILRFDTTPVSLLDPGPVAVGVTQTYAPPVNEFRLERVVIPGGQELELHRAWGPELLLATNADASLSVRHAASSHRLQLGGGGACFVPHAVEYSLSAERTSSCFRVTVPHA